MSLGSNHGSSEGGEGGYNGPSTGGAPTPPEPVAQNTVADAPGLASVAARTPYESAPYEPAPYDTSVIDRPPIDPQWYYLNGGRV